MATSPVSFLVSAALNKVVEKLRGDLKVLEAQMKASKEGMYITHDGDGTILVYASPAYRAYIPKKYDGLDVKFNDWTGGDLPLDLDENMP